MFETTLLLTAAFLAGALNAVAGGGSFLTQPALDFTGVDIGLDVNDEVVTAGMCL